MQSKQPAHSPVARALSARAGLRLVEAKAQFAYVSGTYVFGKGVNKKIKNNMHNYTQADHMIRSPFAVDVYIPYKINADNEARVSPEFISEKKRERERERPLSKSTKPESEFTVHRNHTIS